MKMIINLVIEGNEKELNEIKGKIISSACEALVSVNATEIKEQEKELKIPAFMFLK